jgi:toxin HigB-1
MDRVIFDKVAKQLKKFPGFVVKRLGKWAHDVEQIGMREVRKIPGYHDEPLKGNRAGQRSIRLSKGYRAIYIEFEENQFNIISIEEVNKHDY